MYINWAHHYTPKISGTCSVMINSLFIYIVHDDKKVKLGCYRYLLIFFALYNFTSTAIDLMVPGVCIKTFFQKIRRRVTVCFGSWLLLFLLHCRRSFREAAYCILHCHFVYRYMLLFHRKFLEHFFMPYGLLTSVGYSFMIMVLWFPACWIFAEADDERRNYIAAEFYERYGVDVYDINVITCLYNVSQSERLDILFFKEATSDVIKNSWIGILIGTSISAYSVILCFIFGTFIILRLRSGELNMSEKTKHLQKQLIKVLIVQSSIPVIVCFCPCFAAWYMPVFKLNVGNWINWISAVAISFFPVLDPLALFYFIPVFRSRMNEIFRLKGKIRSGSTRISTI
ncbi:Protein CBR-SRJ-27 [Caenorhabditis briggsae]|uniref:Protein CBR-SRJ-27 n=1 Tax=Caenorhabditis briggsae TaxID=6238 RepID=A8Y2N2_CAEBR|nr:Protein CBR-SRJ-27 [Caenorhabditis briggsae]CAP39157.2 Protein CBR-SRJ-27 [Caenorhabditis briggsae]